MRSRKQRGNAAVETAIIFLPLILLLLGVLELSRAMWMYHTLASAIKSGARYSIVHGADCVEASAACQTSVKDVAAVIRRSGIGLDSSALTLTFTTDSGNYTCGKLSVCLSDVTVWPASSANKAGRPIKIRGVYSFRSVLRSFWPGQASASFNQVAEATEVIQF